MRSLSLAGEAANRACPARRLPAATTAGRGNRDKARHSRPRGRRRGALLGLRGTFLLTAGVSTLGFALTFVLPEPAGRSLEDIAIGAPGRAARSVQIADKAPVP
jgi:hypothetical protein